MRLKTLGMCCAAWLLGGAFTPLFAQSQSLADLARQEEQRRKTVKNPAKVLTNKDLSAPGTAAPVSTPPPAAKPEPAKTGDAAKDAKETKDGKDAKDAEPPKDQAYWSGRLKALRSQLDRDQVYADALQTRINSLTTDFVNRDDPAQKTVIANDKQRALDESNRLKQQIQNDKKAIADLQEEARRAGVPPGWLR